MTKIIYGVSGEGSGHSTRAREMAHCLIEHGHAVKLASYDRGFENLRGEFDVQAIEGLTISSQDNRVSVLKTIGENLRRLPAGNRALWHFRDLFQTWQPDVVITDFEPMSAYLAEFFGLPLITIDNQQRMRYVEYTEPPNRASEAKLTRRLIRAMVPWPSVSLITAFTQGQLKNERCFLYPPLVSQDVREMPSSDEDFVLVYLTSGFDSLLPILKTYPRERFVVYGYNRAETDGNLTLHPASRPRFIDHLSRCKAVIATAGFTLISEALFLGKPYLAMPMSGQYEQELNAFQLADCGYGSQMTELHATGVGDFLYRLPEYRQRLAAYDRAPPTALKTKLIELVADGGAQAAEYKQRRSQE